MTMMIICYDNNNHDNGGGNERYDIGSDNGSDKKKCHHQMK